MATLRKIDNAYVLDWRDQDGTRHRETLGRVNALPEREAKRIVKQRNLELACGYRILNPPESPRFGDFVEDDYLPWHSAEYPASHYRVKQIIQSHLLPTFEHTRLADFAPRAVEAWKHQRLAPGDNRPKAETVGKELRTLKAIFSKAVEWQTIDRHPFAFVAAPLSLDSRPPRFYTRDELAQLYAACSAIVNGGEGPQPKPERASVWRLFANTGMRRSEGLMLKRDWIGKEAIKILSSDEDRTKSGKWREVPLTDGAAAALDELPKEGEYVLPRITASSLSRACINDARRAGLNGSIHTLRHTYISHLVMAGIPLRTVQNLAGHSTIAVTERYAHLAPEHLLQAGRAISL